MIVYILITIVGKYGDCSVGGYCIQLQDNGGHVITGNEESVVSINQSQAILLFLGFFKF